MSRALTTFTKTAIEWLNRLSGWLLLAAIVWLCWGIARIVWLVLAPPPAPNLPVAQLQPIQSPRVNASTALAVFESSQPVVTQQKPPNINLTGVMLAIPNELSSAMLEVNGEMANYRVGETLKGTSYTLADVAWNQVIIADANNHQILIDMPERLSLDQASAGVETEKGAIRNRRLPNSRNAAPSSRAAAIENSRIRDDRIQGSRQNQSNENELEDGDRGPAADNSSSNSAATALEKASNELKSNPASYLSSMGVMATGDGYQITEATPAHIRNTLGLKSGDKVLSVNGQSIGSNPAGDADLLNQVKQSGEAAIEVQRGEQTITIRQQF